MQKWLTEKNGKQSYVCLQLHVVPCQLEWVRSGRWSPSVGLFTCRADIGRTWVGGVKVVKTKAKCVWGVGGGWSWVPFHIQQHTTHAECKWHTQTHTHNTHTCEHTTPTNLLVPAPPSSSSQVMASLGSPLHPWPPHNIPSECPHRHMMCQVMVQHLTCILGVGGVDVWLDIFCNYTFTNKPEQTQSGVDDLKKLCLIFLEKFWCWKVCDCSESNK